MITNLQRAKGRKLKGVRTEKGKGCMVDCLRRPSIQVTVKSLSLLKVEYELSGRSIV